MICLYLIEITELSELNYARPTSKKHFKDITIDYVKVTVKREEGAPNDMHTQTIEIIVNVLADFLEKVDYLQISIANYEIREYSRAIMYLEDVIRQDKEKLCEHLPLLSKAYALYGDLDSVAGASSFQKTAPKIEDLLLSHQVSGQLEEVRIIFERLGKDGLMTPAHMQEMTRCYLNLGEPYTAMNCIKSFTSQQPDLFSILSEVWTCKRKQCIVNR